ncbi:MAG: tRNA (guanosine(37)-N1)-methyltransferase TrmD [bacterium]
MKFDIITIFPEIFPTILNSSILGRAQKNNLIEIQIHNLRDFTRDRHRTVDDVPFGGGVGMLFKIEPIFKALYKLTNNFQKNPKRRIILFDPRGEKLNQKYIIKSAKKYNHYILICPRYEGVDERIKKFVDDTVSVGDYILSGAEIPAMLFVDSISRQIPKVLGKAESLADETFKTRNYKKYPQYTLPREFQGMQVPKVLLSGDHKKIEEWRKKNSK